MPFAICGVHEVPAFAAIPLDHIVSFREAHQPGPDIRGFKTEFTLHSFVFADTGDPANPLAPSEEAVRRLLGVYTQALPDQNVLFHCFAGVSRSSAAAFIWLAYHGVPYEKAYDLVVAVRGPFVCPNQLMVTLADGLMGRAGAMSEFVRVTNTAREPDRAAAFAAMKQVS